MRQNDKYYLHAAAADSMSPFTYNAYNKTLARENSVTVQEAMLSEVHLSYM